MSLSRPAALPMFINAKTRQQIAIYSIGHHLYLLAFGKVGVQKFFSLAPLANLVLYPHLKIRGAAPDHTSNL